MFELSRLRKLLIELLHLVDDLLYVLTIQHLHIVKDRVHLREILLATDQQCILKLHFYFQ